MPAKYTLVLCTAILTAFLLTTSLHAEESTLENWYQVDVIIFKPVRTDLDEESWPEFERSYPNDVISVDGPGPFKLSQLEQLGELPDAAPLEEVQDVLGGDEFVFESRSRTNRNRRVVEAITGAGSADDTDVIEAVDPPNIEQGETTDVEAALSTPAELPEADPYSAGALAFSRTDDSSSLESIRRSLRFSSRFEVLDHLSWVQPINSEATSVMVQTGQRYDDQFEIEGTLSFTRSRFLHVNTDLWYTHFEPKGTNVSSYVEGIETNLGADVLKQYEDLVKVERQRGSYFPARTHKMVQSRRMRSDELHYLDHPLFGVVVRINRYRVPE